MLSTVGATLSIYISGKEPCLLLCALHLVDAPKMAVVAHAMTVRKITVAACPWQGGRKMAVIWTGA